MRLVLPIDATWQRRELDELRSEVVVVGTFDAPEVALVLYHPRAGNVSLREWIEQVVTGGIVRDEAVTIVDAGDVANELGWRTHVIYAQVRRPDRPDPVELRLTAFYRFSGYDAAAMVIGRRPEPYEARRPDMLALFGKGRPDWNGPTVAALADFYR